MQAVDTAQQLPAQLDAAAVGESDVEHGDIRSYRRYPGQRLRDGGGLADHLEIGVGLEQFDETPSDDFMVVDQEDPDHAVSLRHRTRASNCKTFRSHFVNVRTPN